MMSGSTIVSPTTEQEAAESLLALVNAHAQCSHQSSTEDFVSRDEKEMRKHDGQHVSIPKKEIMCPKPQNFDAREPTEDTKILNIELVHDEKSPSNEKTDDASSISSSASESSKSSNGERKSLSSYQLHTKNVPEILMHLLLDPLNQSIMSFQEDRSSFAIHNVKKFSDTFLKKYFKLTKFGCFLGKLERWGFSHRSIGSDLDRYIFTHPSFKENDWTSLEKVNYAPRSNRTKMKPRPRQRCHSVSRSRSDSRTYTSNCHELNDSITLDSIQATIDRHVELSASLLYMNATKEISNLQIGIPPLASKTIVDAAIACLRRDEAFSRNSSGTGEASMSNFGHNATMIQNSNAFLQSQGQPLSQAFQMSLHNINRPGVVRQRHSSADSCSSISDRS